MTTRQLVSYYMGRALTEADLVIYKELITLGYANPIDIAAKILEGSK